MSAVKHRDALPPGFKLHWYELDSVLGQGGFGITYLGQDTNLGQPVAVKEYLPNEFAVREGDSTVQPKTGEQGDIYKWGLERFLQEARTLAKFKHPNIVRVLSVFEQNNTAYMVMEYERGSDLSQQFKRGNLKDEAQLLAIVLPILKGLELVHQAGFIHRDIKPANIYLREQDKTPVLLDFGSARHALGEQTKTMTSLVSLGYAPFEQYQDADGKQGPWSDIYSLGATLYYGVTGRTPAEAMTRGNEIINHGRDPYEPVWSLVSNSYSDHFLNAIDNALAFRFAERPQNLDTWGRMLRGEIQAPRVARDERADVPDLDPTVVAPPHQTTRPDSTVQRTKRTTVRPTRTSKVTIPDRKLLLYGSIAAGAIVVLVVGIVLMIGSGDDVPGAISTTPPTQERTAKKDPATLAAQYVAEADADFAAGRLISPGGDNALEGYQNALEVEPGNLQAMKGMSRLSDHFLGLANSYVNDGQLAQAEQQLEIVDILHPGKAGVAQARADIADRRRSLEQQTQEQRLTEQTREEQQRIADEQKKQREAERLAQVERERKLAEQKEAARLARVERERRLAEQKKAERLAKAERERQLAKATEPEPVAVQPQSAATARSSAGTSARPDLQVASQMIGRFKSAFERRDAAGLERVAEMSPSRKQFVRFLFKDYARIEIDISNFTYLQAQKSASATMTIRRLVASDGKATAPPDSWKQARLILRSRGGKQWDKIRW